MRLKNIVLNLTADEVQEILRVDLDGDPAEALELVRSVLAKKVREALKMHCVPVFDVGYSPGQKDEFSKG